jgi:uncharacterized membrane protein YeaQ/YmgE (transglycosylase-associated protein family)
MLLDLLGWAVMGFITGFVGSKLVNLRGDDPQVDLIVGVLGAVFAGILCNILSGVGISGFTYWSFVAALAGAAAAVASWHTVRKFTSHA